MIALLFKIISHAIGRGMIPCLFLHTRGITMRYDVRHKLDKGICANDGIMRHIDNPYLDVDAKQIVATDGHGLILVPVEIEDGDQSGYIPIDAIREGQKKQNRIGDKVEIDCSISDTVSLKYAGLTFRRPNDTTYPDYKRVIPDKPVEYIEIGLDAAKLKALADGISKDRKGAVRLLIDANNSNAAVHLSSGTENNQATAILMPIRFSSV